MIKITYPGANNYSTFAYDGLSRNVSIVETTAGSVTSTKQFVWAGVDRREERDGSGTLTKKFFDRGQTNSATKYSYAKDHLNSVREMTDNSGVIQAEYAFDPFGRVTEISETVPSDYGYACLYVHARSGLNLTRTRAFSSILGRFASRDIVEEFAGPNLYCYVNNIPTNLIDPTGLEPPPNSSIGDIRNTINESINDFEQLFPGDEPGGGFDVGPGGQVSNAGIGFPGGPNAWFPGPVVNNSDWWQKHKKCKGIPDNTPREDLQKACDNKKRLWVVFGRNLLMFDGTACKNGNIPAYKASRNSLNQLPDVNIPSRPSVSPPK